MASTSVVPRQHRVQQRAFCPRVASLPSVVVPTTVLYCHSTTSVSLLQSCCPNQVDLEAASAVVRRQSQAWISSQFHAAWTSQGSRSISTHLHSEYSCDRTTSFALASRTAAAAAPSPARQVMVVVVGWNCKHACRGPQVKPLCTTVQRRLSTQQLLQHPKLLRRGILLPLAKVSITGLASKLAISSQVSHHSYHQLMLQDYISSS